MIVLTGKENTIPTVPEVPKCNNVNGPDATKDGTVVAKENRDKDPSDTQGVIDVHTRNTSSHRTNVEDKERTVLSRSKTNETVPNTKVPVAPAEEKETEGKGDSTTAPSDGIKSTTAVLEKRIRKGSKPCADGQGPVVVGKDHSVTKKKATVSTVRFADEKNNRSAIVAVDAGEGILDGAPCDTKTEGNLRNAKDVASENNNDDAVHKERREDVVDKQSIDKSKNKKVSGNSNGASSSSSASSSGESSSSGDSSSSSGDSSSSSGNSTSSGASSVSTHLSGVKKNFNEKFDSVAVSEKRKKRNRALKRQLEEYDGAVPLGNTDKSKSPKNEDKLKNKISTTVISGASKSGKTSKKSLLKGTERADNKSTNEDRKSTEDTIEVKPNRNGEGKQTAEKEIPDEITVSANPSKDDEMEDLPCSDLAIKEQSEMREARDKDAKHSVLTQTEKKYALSIFE